MKALLIWPQQPLLSLLVLLVIAVPFMYAARAPMQDFIARLTRALSTPLRLGSHWLARTATRLQLRNREVLFAHGGREMKLYRITANGRKQLTQEQSKWETLSRAMARMLRPVK